MFRKWLEAGCAFLRAAGVERKRLDEISARPHLEVLEDRLAPAVAQWVDAPKTNDWSDNMKRPWVGAAAPGAADTAVFAWTASSPELSKPVTFKELLVRSDAGAGTYTTNLDLKGQDLTATKFTNVVSAPIGAALTAFGKGKAADTVFVVNNSTDATWATLTSDSVDVGTFGYSQKAGPQNRASMTINYGVTVDAPVHVAVGGDTVGTLTVNGGYLTTRSLQINSVHGNNLGAGDASQIVVKNAGDIAVNGFLSIGISGAPGPAAPAALLDVGSGSVSATDISIGGADPGSLIARSGSWVTTSKTLEVGSTGATGTLDIQGGTVNVGWGFTNDKKGITLVQVGGLLDLAKGGINNGILKVADGGILKARTQKIINKGTIKGTGAPGAATGRLDMQGDFTQQADGHLAIQIAGNQVGVSYDRLLVSALDDGTGGGNVTLDGTLDVSSTYAPKPWLIGGPAGDYFTVVSASQSLSGHFNPLTGLNLPDPSQFAASLPALPAGYGYQWHVIYDTTDSFDSNLAASDPALSSQPWAGNGTRDAVLVLEEAPLKPDLVITSATPSGTNSVTVGYIVENQAVTQAFNVSLFTSQDGHTPDTPNTPFATVAVASAALGVQTATITFPGQALPAGE